MRFKLHQEETLPEHQKKFSHTKKIMVCLINYTTLLNQPGIRFGIPSYVTATTTAQYQPGNQSMSIDIIYCC